MNNNEQRNYWQELLEKEAQNFYSEEQIRDIWEKIMQKLPENLVSKDPNQ